MQCLWLSNRSASKTPISSYPTLPLSKTANGLVKATNFETTSGNQRSASKDYGYNYVSLIVDKSTDLLLN